MIQNGKGDLVTSGGFSSHPRPPSTSSAFLKRSPYHNGIRKQTTELVHNVDFMDNDFSHSLNDDKSNEPQNEEMKWIHEQSNDNSLSFEQMWELQKILDRRVKCKLSEGLSPEGRKAMEMAKAEVELANRKGMKVPFSCRDLTTPELELQMRQKRGKLKKKISFVDAYESSSASRLSGDIMDENSSEGNQRRWALGGGNINVAMETVEIVSFGDTSSSDADDMAIEETAKLNSVEKCLVWMGVHTEEEFDEQR